MSPMRSNHLSLLLILSFLLLSVPALAQTQAFIHGTITASQTPGQPNLGAWKYTIEMSWCTGTNLGMDHFDIMLDEIARGCSNEEIQMGVIPGDTVGLAPFDVRDAVYFQPEFMFQGDPLVPTLGQMLKIAPFPNQNLVPGPSGTGVFHFYSDSPPTEFEYPGLFLVDSAREFVCGGSIMGVFPGLVCDPVPTEKQNWGYIKALYGRR